MAYGQVLVDPVVLTIGAEKITKSQFDLILATLPPEQRSMAESPEGRRRVAEQLTELKTLAQEARVQKLDQSPDMKIRLALQTDQVLAAAAYQHMGEAKLDDAAVKAYYDEHKAEMEQVRARHILIRFQGSRVPLRLDQKDLTEDEALTKIKEIRAKIVGGAKFADVAMAESDDTGTGANGGDLGTFPKGGMVPEFDAVAFSIKVGELSDPVKTAFGYHLILVESRSPKPLEDARADIEKKLRPEMSQKGLDALKKKSPAVFDPIYFGK